MPTASRTHLLRLLLGSVIISSAPIFIKLAQTGPDASGFWRMVFAVIALSCWIFISGCGWHLPTPAIKFAVAGGIALGVDFMCWHRSIDLIGPGLATLLGNFQIFFTALFSWLLFKERITSAFCAAVVLAVVGLICITGIDIDALSAQVWLGLLLGLATAFCYSFVILAIKQAMSYAQTDSRAVLLVLSTCTSLIMALTATLNGAPLTIGDTTTLISLASAGIFCSTIAWALISTSMGFLPATTASLVLLLQPALALVWDVLFFARPTGMLEVFGVLLILSGIYLGSVRSKTP